MRAGSFLRPVAKEPVDLGEALWIEPPVAFEGDRGFLSGMGKEEL